MRPGWYWILRRPCLMTCRTPASSRTPPSTPPRRTGRSPPPTTPTRTRSRKRAGRRHGHQHLQQSRRADRAVRPGRCRADPGQDPRVRHRREPDIGIHQQHRRQRVERHQRGLHLQRPRPGPDRIRGNAHLRGRPRPVNDSGIAACCLAHDLPLATFNAKDYADYASHDGLHLITTEPQWTEAGSPVRSPGRQQAPA
jgi:hypothetical protein